MEVHFATKKIAEILAHDKRRVRTYGADVAKKIAMRLYQLHTADSLDSLRHEAGRCHELHEDRAGQLAMDLTRNYRLVFTPTAAPPPLRDDGGLDWAGVTAITVLEVTDYHGD